MYFRDSVFYVSRFVNAKRLLKMQHEAATAAPQNTQILMLADLA